jgi:hypothetical protein
MQTWHEAVTLSRDGRRPIKLVRMLFSNVTMPT